MPTFGEILQARNEIYAENAVTEDDLIRVCWQKQIDQREEQARNKDNRRKPKTITYLSKQDREAVIILAAISQSLQNVVDEWDALGNRPTFVLRSLRCAKTMVYKVINWLVKDVPEEDYVRVLKDVGYFVIGAYEYEPRKKGTINGRL